MILSFYDPIYYSAKTVSKNAPNVLMTNIFRNYKKYFDRVAVNYNLTTYYIQGSPRPETLSNQIYGNTQLYWILLFANSIYDPYHGWIKSQEACYDSVAQQYENPESEIAYHINVKNEKFFNLVQSRVQDGIWYDKGDTDQSHIQYVGALVPVNAYEAAILENEEKRKIRIVNPTDIERFMSDFIKELERNVK